MTTFSAPAAPGATGDKFDIKAHNGALLLIDVNGIKEQVETVHGPADAIACNIAVLDGEHKGDEYDDTLVFPRVLVGQLKGSIGKQVLARLGQGEKQPGKNPAWILNAPTDDDTEVAGRYVAFKAKKAAAVSEDF
jgi:hypothetical protein